MLSSGELSRRTVKEADAEMFLQLRDLAGDRSLAELALTGEAENEPVSTTRTRIPSAPRRSIDFLEKRKDHPKTSVIIALRQEAYPRAIAYRRRAPGGEHSCRRPFGPPWNTEALHLSFLGSGRMDNS